ncbi:pentatricopeptide repeat-containing protein At3g22470, mitochondrial-like [Impatiens glandulifera]|uniref:pentatricopeptide repeat-containing protein At3g22470, mitochondrial-like n=1 Tax=Impatiens glandulifera TaxID=253017 RepID=UPI001FB16B7C|nr:pentatricopeptide repeat-containing protein At3g22470, mitochondrial-like [Impatiens glandulifera]
MADTPFSNYEEQPEFSEKSSIKIKKVEIVVAFKKMMKDLLAEGKGKEHYYEVSKLAKTSHIRCQFSPTSCVLQDLKDNITIGTGELSQNLYLFENVGSKSGAVISEPERFRRLIGRLIYLSFTRPDIGFSVQQLSQYMNQPLQIHWDATLQVVRYLKGTPGLGLFYPCVSNNLLESFSDVYWATCADSRRSVTEAFELFDDMRTKSILPTLFRYSSLIHGFCNIGKVEDAKNLIIVMRKEGLLPNVVCYTAFIGGYCMLGQMDQVRNVLHEMLFYGIHPNKITYTVMIDGYSKIGDTREARKLLAQMMVKGIIPL